LRKFPVVSGQSSVYSPIIISPALVVILTTVGMQLGALTGTRAYVCRPKPNDGDSQLVQCEYS